MMMKTGISAILEYHVKIVDRYPEVHPVLWRTSLYLMCFMLLLLHFEDQLQNKYKDVVVKKLYSGAFVKVVFISRDIFKKCLLCR